MSTERELTPGSTQQLHPLSYSDMATHIQLNGVIMGKSFNESPWTSSPPRPPSPSQSQTSFDTLSRKIPAYFLFRYLFESIIHKLPSNVYNQPREHMPKTRKKKSQKSGYGPGVRSKNGLEYGMEMNSPVLSR